VQGDADFGFLEPDAVAMMVQIAGGKDESEIHRADVAPAD
jgi:hypothetical protein